jgi:hypothetical protein
MEFHFQTNNKNYLGSISNTEVRDQAAQAIVSITALENDKEDIEAAVENLAIVALQLLGQPILNEGPELSFIYQVTGTENQLMLFRAALGLQGVDPAIDEEALHEAENQG